MQPKFEYIYRSIVDSTQLLAKRDLQTNPLTDNETWRVYTASRQTAGYGTNQRHWFSPPEVNLYTSIAFLMPQVPYCSLFNLTQVTAYSLARTLHLYGFKPAIKWVNDLLLAHKKVAGVLCEAIHSPTYPKHVLVILGIGLNINMHSVEEDTQLQAITSLYLESGRYFSVHDILRDLLFCLAEDVNLYKSQGFSGFYPKYMEYLAYKNTEIQFNDGQKTSVYQLIGISNDGRLALYDKRDNLLKYFSLGRIIL